MGLLYVLLRSMHLAPVTYNVSLFRSLSSLLVPWRAPAHQLPFRYCARAYLLSRGECPSCPRPTHSGAPLGWPLSPGLDYFHVLRPSYRRCDVRHRHELEKLRTYATPCWQYIYPLYRYYYVLFSTSLEKHVFLYYCLLYIVAIELVFQSKFACQTRLEKAVNDSRLL